MILRNDLIQGIEDFFATVPGKTLQRGRSYHARGAVLELECLEPNRLFDATVAGGENYHVVLTFGPGGWSSSCSCPMYLDCKHVVAVLLKLRESAIPSDKISIDSVIPASKNKSFKLPASPPRSPLWQRLAENLGRELRAKEAGFVRRVQAFYADTASRVPLESDLFHLLENHNVYGHWQPLQLWPRRPEDDFFCWLYLAQELRRRKFRYPDFMEAITDLSLIAAEWAAWEREQEIARWQKRFSLFDETTPVASTVTLDLRVIFHPHEARLQWRTRLDAEFTDFKQPQAKRFAGEFERANLNLTLESLPLWSAVFHPWHYESWWSFKYKNSNAVPILNRVLRLPLAPDRLVTGNQQPLVRVAEPLRLRLQPPADGGTDYELTLVMADGSPAPPIECSFPGEPTLYLTAQGLFSGPAAPSLDLTVRHAIPAPALETVDGLRFLHAAGVPLPEHLAQRVQTVPVPVTISCELKLVYPGSQLEDIVIRVVSRPGGQPSEQFTAQGWLEQTGRAVKKIKPEKNVILVHDRAPQRHFPALLESLGAKWDGFPGEWRLRLTKKVPELFVAWLKSVPPEIEVLLSPELASLRDEPLSGSVSLDITEAATDWFDLKVVLNVSDTTLTPEELKLLLNAKGAYVRLGRKGWRRLQFDFTPEEDEQLARLGLHAQDFSAEPQRFHALQLADESAKKFLGPERVEKIQRRVEELKTRVAPALPSGIHATLRPYQTEGYHFLAYLATNHFGGVLADDMGLGKTVQTLAWLAWLRDSAAGGKAAASLVVCPKSVTDNWRAEAGRFYPELRVRLWQGEPATELPAAREANDLIVINYSQLRSLSPTVADGQWQAVILDEAQYIKNPDSQTAQSARALTAEHRLALTGTPIENRLLDLWSILAFAMPGALGNRSQFLRRFNTQEDPLARRRLAARVRPFLLRRTKTQVAKDLPDRVEEDLFCEMEGAQRLLYHAELKRARQLILGLKSNQQLNAERFNVLTSLLRLRQICCHPALVDGKLREAESAKVAVLLDLLAPLMEEGHKVLVFSQFVTMLDLLRETIQQNQWPHFYLSGATENRGELVQQFQSASGGAVFLISLKAGGFGLNLTAASYVVLFDPWWNPAVENQAIDRTHRIGQTSKVMAYRLLIRDSIEQKIRALQKQKGALMNDVLGEERFAQTLTLEDLRFLFAE